MSSSLSSEPTAPGPLIVRSITFVSDHLFELALGAMIIYVCIARGMVVNVDLYDPQSSLPPAAPTTGQSATATATAFDLRKALSSLRNWVSPPVTDDVTPRLASQPTNKLGTTAPPPERTTAINSSHAGFNDVANTGDPAPHISNLTLVLSPDYGKRKNLPAHIISAKKARVQQYLSRYAAAARAEMEQHGIPASITLAQGLLESNAGDSRLARESANHFGIKCRKKCLGCTCRNYGDDTRYDMFRVFASPAESFREHSQLLNYPRYRKLKKYGKDYVSWAHGLQQCGYATDQRYGKKLVTIIENLGLARFDR